MENRTETDRGVIITSQEYKKLMRTKYFVTLYNEYVERAFERAKKEYEDCDLSGEFIPKRIDNPDNYALYMFDAGWSALANAEGGNFVEIDYGKLLNEWNEFLKKHPELA